MMKDFEFAELVLWVCPKCGTGIKTRELQLRCQVCGFRESSS